MPKLEVSPDPDRSKVGGAGVLASAQLLLGDALAGTIASVVLLANIVSFAALMFPGDLSGGFTTAIWAMLVGSSIGGIIISLTTSLPPIASGIDSPTGAVLVLLSATTASVVTAGGGTPAQAIPLILMLFTAATMLSGVILYALGALRLGSSLRFVPYFVVGGFLAATGWFLIAGGVRMTTGHQLTWSNLAQPWTALEGTRLAATVFVLAVLLVVRRRTTSPLGLPVTLLVLWAALALALGAARATAPSSGWYFAGLGPLTPWTPWSALSGLRPLLATIAHVLPELIAVALVSLISLVTKAASIEVSRNMSADLDGELKGHGLASLAAAPFGGFLTAMQIGTSKLLEQTGSTGRIGGVVSGLVLGLVALLNLDVQAWVPTVLIGGLVLFLGYTFLVEALARPLAQRAWHDVVLALIIAACCVQYGFLFGILIGIIAACVMFAFNYARIGVVRRHATRAQFSSHVDRSEAETRYLREAGGAVQIYWLSGFIFFGSAERLFERIRVDLEAAGNVKHSFVVLDFHGVPGADSSAVLSLMKLRNYCDKRGIAVVCSSLSAHNAAGLERRGLFGGKSRHRLFPTLDAALSFCEEDLLFRGQLDGAAGEPSFADWLARQLGGVTDCADAFSYLELSEIDGTRQLYHQGEPANSIELVASGRLHVHVAGQRGQELRIRQFTTHTVVGEMGFFRQGVRSASISTDGPATLYTLKREAFERMRQERPGLALAFDDFIIRTLADRLEFANRTVDALSR